MVEAKFAFRSMLNAGFTPYFIPSSLGVVGVEHFNDDNVDGEGVDCPALVAESFSEFTSVLTRLLCLFVCTETIIT